MKKILVIIGTRPEAIKMAPVIKGLEDSKTFDVQVCNTGQHQKMINQVLEIFGITPKYNLFVMKKNQTLSAITSKILQGLEEIFTNNKYDFVMVHGDTTSCFAGALAAFYNRIPVVHVEAGLRTGDIYSPWPEEFNRVVVGKIAHIHFAPTATAKANLILEKTNKEYVSVTGNTVIDALRLVEKKIKKDSLIREKLNNKYDYLDKTKKLILVTGHRRENFGEGLENICKAIRKIACRKDVEVIYPVHLNPNVKIPVMKLLGGKKNIFLIDPVDYIDFVYLMTESRLILTDSGGVQEEAPFLGKPIILLRDKTERLEAVSAGIVKLAGTNQRIIEEEAIKFLECDVNFRMTKKMKTIYGDGKATNRILKALTNFELK